MRHLKPNHSSYRNIQQLKLTLKKNCSNFLPVTIRRAIFGSPMTVFETQVDLKAIFIWVLQRTASLRKSKRKPTLPLVQIIV